MGNRSMFFFARPSMLEGVARILDFSGALSTYDSTENGQQADSRALASDWAAIGLDIRQSIELYSPEKLDPSKQPSRTLKELREEAERALQSLQNKRMELSIHVDESDVSVSERGKLIIGLLKLLELNESEAQHASEQLTSNERSE